MDAFPAYFPLAGAKIVVAGSGEGAEAKARLFDGSPARLVRAEGPEAFLAGTYAGASLVFVASPDDLFVQAAVTAARAARAYDGWCDVANVSNHDRSPCLAFYVIPGHQETSATGFSFAASRWSFESCCARTR